MSIRSYSWCDLPYFEKKSSRPNLDVHQQRQSSPSSIAGFFYPYPVMYGLNPCYLLLHDSRRSHSHTVRRYKDHQNSSTNASSVWRGLFLRALAEGVYLPWGWFYQLAHWANQLSDRTVNQSALRSIYTFICTHVCTIYSHLYGVLFWFKCREFLS